MYLMCWNNEITAPWKAQIILGFFCLCSEEEWALNHADVTLKIIIYTMCMCKSIFTANNFFRNAGLHLQMSLFMIQKYSFVFLNIKVEQHMEKIFETVHKSTDQRKFTKNVEKHMIYHKSFMVLLNYLN